MSAPHPRLVLNGTLLVALVALLPVACRDVQPPPAVEQGDDVLPVDADTPVAPAPMDEEVLPGPPTTVVPEDIIVSTNEPFWNARVQEGVVVLTGAGQPERRLSIESAQVTGDASAIRASDANGNLLIEVERTPCQDSMSGAEYPMTGRLSFDGEAAILGCARPASMPVPPEPLA